MEGRNELRERNQTIFVAVIFLENLVNDLLRPPEPLPLGRLCVLGGVVPVVTLRDVLLIGVVVVVIMAKKENKASVSNSDQTQITPQGFDQLQSI